jgi:hypothetical protein
MPDLVFTLNRSRLLLMGLVILHVLALIAGMGNTLPVSVRLFLSVFILGHFVLCWQRYWVKADADGLMYSDAAGWARMIGDVPMPIQILPSTILTPFLIIVHYQGLSSNVPNATWVCFMDALPQSAFRQLTVQLKITGLQTKDPDI